MAAEQGDALIPGVPTHCAGAFIKYPAFTVWQVREDVDDVRSVQYAGFQEQSIDFRDRCRTGLRCFDQTHTGDTCRCYQNSRVIGQGCKISGSMGTT